MKITTSAAAETRGPRNMGAVTRKKLPSGDAPMVAAACGISSSSRETAG